MKNNYFKYRKIGILSDLHIGVHKDSDDWHKIALDFVDWLILKLNENQIEDLVICGDFFHTRHELEMSSLQCGTEFLRRLKDFNVTITTGNHCCYFRDNSDIHSLEPFKEWDNVRIIDKMEYHESHGKTFGFCPWGIPVADIQKCNTLFGHFELINFEMAARKICDHGVDSASLCNVCDLVLTGHFHTRQHRRYEEKQILYMGSPMQLDWGDVTNDKGLTILDIETNEISLIGNDISPRHVKHVLSNIKESLQGDSKKLENDTRGNIIELEVDKELDPAILDAVLIKISQYKPLQLKTKFNVPNINYKVDSSLDIPDVDIGQTFDEYINHMDLDKKIDKLVIADRCKELYTAALKVF